MARKVKFSANCQKAKRRVTNAQRKIRNTRNDRLHQASTMISKNHAVVVLEDLRITNMTASAKGTIENPGTNVLAKSGLNRRILDQGWGEFCRQLGYKLAWNGGTLLLVDSRNTSRTCAQCAQVSRENRQTQSAFRCLVCGHAANADTECCNQHPTKGWIGPDRLWRFAVRRLVEAGNSACRVSDAWKNPRTLGRGVGQRRIGLIVQGEFDARAPRRVVAEDQAIGGEKT